MEDIPNKVRNIQVSNEQLLDGLNLISEGLLTRAAILLFHHNPEKWIPGFYVKIAYFQSESDILYQDEVHGSLLSQADRVDDLIKYNKGSDACQEGNELNYAQKKRQSRCALQECG